MNDRVWRVQLLGGLRAVRGEQAVTRFRSQKAAVLLAYLALFSQRAHTREQLADLFWPDADAEAGRVNLRTALSALRRELEPTGVTASSVLVTPGHTEVRLDLAAVSTDVAAFEHALKNAARSSTPPDERARWLNDAIALYTGPLLPGSYETWVLDERDRLAGAYLRTLRDLAAFHEKAGEFDQALGFARRAVDADPLSEEAHADVIRLLGATDDRVAAIRQFQELERRLDAELGMEPSPKVRALLEAVKEGRLRRAAATPSLHPKLVAPVPSGSVHGEFRVASTNPEPSASDLQQEPPTSPTSPPLRLPPTFTPFFGREGEVAALVDLLDGAGAVRLVTVTGPGGGGKTRLSIETARQLAPSFPGGVWFVPLADLGDPEHIGAAIAERLGLSRAATPSPLEQVITALNEGHKGANSPTLLVLDNFEQLVEAQTSGGAVAGASLIQALVERVPTLSCLITSRQKLLIEAEHEFVLSPLPTPAHPGTPERLLEFASVQLFVNRARAARPDFRLDGRNAATVAELCTRLEGIPLALELAAAWSRTLTPNQILERLERRFDLLVARRRDAPARHATLRAAVEWSYDLLSPDLKGLFARLSVFRGGWTLEAACAVCRGDGDTAADGAPERDVLEGLTELCERSLVFAAEDAASGAMRYRMLETLREFADEQLSQDERAAAQRSLAAFFVALAEEVRPHPQEAQNEAVGARWLGRLGTEQDNLRAALDNCAASGTEGADQGLRLATALAPFWFERGLFDEACRRLALLLDIGNDAGGRDEAVRADALLTLARLTNPDVQPERACIYYQEACALYAGRNDKRRLAEASIGLALPLARLGEHARSREAVETGLRLAREIGDRHMVASALSELAWRICEAGDLAGGRACLEESQAIIEAERAKADHASCCSYTDLSFWVSFSLGYWSLQYADFADAEERLSQWLAMRREQQLSWAVAHALRLLGEISLGTGDFAGARARLEESIAITDDLGNPGPSAEARHLLAWLHEEQGELAEAERLLRGRCLPVFRAADNVPGLTAALDSAARVAGRRGDIRAARQFAQESLLLRQSRGSAKDLLSSLTTFAVLARHEGEPANAARLWGSAEALREQMQVPWTPLERQQIEKRGAVAARAALSEEAFRAAWNAGRELTLPNALVLACGDGQNDTRPATAD